MRSLANKEFDAHFLDFISEGVLKDVVKWEGLNVRQKLSKKMQQHFTEPSNSLLSHYARQIILEGSVSDVEEFINERQISVQQKLDS